LCIWTPILLMVSAANDSTGQKADTLLHQHAQPGRKLKAKKHSILQVQ